MDARIRLRHDSTYGWNMKNPILLQGEAGYNTTTKELILGDGKSRAMDLPPFATLAVTQAMIEEAISQVDAGSGAAVHDELMAHIASITPHPAYDDGPSLVLLYQNAKV